MISISEAMAEVMGAASIEKRAVCAPRALNEAYDYDRPSSFSRAMRLGFGNVVVLLISGTASIGANGETLNVGDFRAQTRRTFDNITALLESEGASWKDVVLLISGTASIGANGETLNVGDFRAQTRRTFDNITALLESEGASWKDVVRTTCYLRDIERDY